MTFDTVTDMSYTKPWWEDMKSCRHFLRVVISKRVGAVLDPTPMILSAVFRGARVVGKSQDTFFLGFTSAFDMHDAQNICSMSGGTFQCRRIDPYAVLCTNTGTLTLQEMKKVFDTFGPIFCISQHYHVSRRRSYIFVNFKTMGDVFRVFAQASVPFVVSPKVMAHWQTYPPKPYSPFRMQGECLLVS